MGTNEFTIKKNIDFSFLGCECYSTCSLNGSKTISPFLLQDKTPSPYLWWSMMWAFLTTTGDSPLAQDMSAISGSGHRNALRSVGACVTKRACLWLTGWKRGSWKAPFHSGSQLKPNWFGPGYTCPHVTRRRPVLLWTCLLFANATPLKYVCDVGISEVLSISLRGYFPSGIGVGLSRLSYGSFD